MKNVFLTLLLISTVFLSTIFFVALSIRLTPITPERIKTEIVKLNLYDTAVSELSKQLTAMATAGDGEDPFAIIEPFVKKEITAPYIREKAEKLIDDTTVWLGGSQASPTVSFIDLKEKLIKQNKKMIGDLETAIEQISTNPDGTLPSFGDAFEEQAMPSPPTFTASDFRKFMSSDFTVPIGQYLSGLKFFLNAAWYALVISAGLLFVNLLLILLIAQGFQSKLRWIGATLLCTALWNVPGTLLGVGSTALISTFLTQNIQGFSISLVKPLVEILITPVLQTFAGTTGGAVVALLIMSVGMIVLSFIAKPVEVLVQPQVARGVKQKK